MSSIADFLGITIVGAGLSGLVQYIKAKWGVDGFTTKVVVIVLAILIGSLYVLLRDTVLWSTILGVLAAASTVYALLLN